MAQTVCMHLADEAATESLGHALAAVLPDELPRFRAIGYNVEACLEWALRNNYLKEVSIYDADDGQPETAYVHSNTDAKTLKGKTLKSIHEHCFAGGGGIFGGG